MSQPPELPSLYQLRIVLREISPLIWRRLLVCSDTTLAQLHTMLQITFDWSDAHLHTFHVHGQDEGVSELLICYHIWVSERNRTIRVRASHNDYASATLP